MRRNIVDIFSRGNQELFHSAFLAWLLDDKGDHGLGKVFRSQLLARLPDLFQYDRDGDYAVITEVTSGRSRVDIVLTPAGKTGQPEQKPLAFENKVKSFGTALQLDKYQNQGYNIAVLALLPQTLDSETTLRYPVVNYADIRDLLKNLRLDSSNPFQFIVLQYLEFLEKTLGAYEALLDYCYGKMEFGYAMGRLSREVAGSTFRGNDIRTFSYFYYYTLAEFIKSSAADLAFGTPGYEEAEKAKANTRWLFEKNMQGPPFMEAIIYSPFDTPHWTLNRAFRAIPQVSPLQIAPRIEIWLDPIKLSQARNEHLEIGTLMLGTWSRDFKSIVSSQEPYRSSLKRRGNRHFHSEPLTLADLPFSCMVQRIRRMMQLIFDYNGA